MAPTKPKRIKEPEDDREFGREDTLPLSELLPEVGAEFSIDDTIAQMAKDKLWWYEHVERDEEE